MSATNKGQDSSQMAWHDFRLSLTAAEVPCIKGLYIKEKKV